MKKDLGFTLFEILVVLALIAIISAMAVPNLIGWLPNYRLGSAAREILSAVDYARLSAVKQNTFVGLSFNTDGDRYTLWIDNGNGGGIPKDAVRNGTEPIIKSGQMPADIDITDASFGALSQFLFNGMGIPIKTDDSPVGGNVILTNGDGTTRTIKITKGGHAKIQ